MEGFGRMDDLVSLFSNMLRDASNYDLTSFARMTDAEILRRAHSVVNRQVYDQGYQESRTITPQMFQKEIVPQNFQTLVNCDLDAIATSAEGRQVNNLEPVQQPASKLDKVKAKPTGPIRPLARRPINTDEDGFHHMRVCDSGECDEDWCHFQYKPAQFPEGWTPNFRNKDKKTGKSAEGALLVAYGVDSSMDWEDSRDDLLKYLGDVRTASVNVRDGNDYAFIACFSHADAVEAKKNLTINGDYTVKFVCSNMPKLPKSVKK